MPTDQPSGARVRAAAAADSVTAAFGSRLFGLPGTHLGAVAAPPPTGGPWHYWWQAHYLDCLIDAAEREAVNGDGTSDGAAYIVRARRLLRSIRIRNGGRWTNSYYDDMAWLALAALRAADAAATRPIHVFESVLTSAHTPDLGGGLFWNTARDFKNTPATAPAALYFARIGRTEEARSIIEWLYERLHDSATGLFLDGIRTRGNQVVTDVYTYNQGPVLGTLLALGDQLSLQRAALLVDAVAGGLTLPTGALRTHGGGDGGLFTGILARYLALVAGSRLPAAQRQLAATLITTTADALWEGRAERVVGGSRRSVLLFPSAPGTNVGDGPVELSTQLQAWMIFEAAARAERVDRPQL